MSRSLSNPIYLASPQKGVDGRTTLAKARAPLVTDGRVGDFYIDTVAKKLYGPKNAAGWPDNGLIKGDGGWSPVLGVVANGSRRVYRVIDWQGGEGIKPVTGQYVGSNGLVANVDDAVDVRGPAGPDMLIDALVEASAEIVDDTLLPTAQVGNDNEKRVAVEIFDLGGELPRRTIAHAQSSSIRPAISTIIVRGYSERNDGGGASYRRVNSEPAHSGKFRTLDRWTADGDSDSANGGWWEISERMITPKMLGAKGDGIADDTVALQSAANTGILESSDGVYRHTSTITLPSSCRVGKIKLLADFADPMATRRIGVFCPKRTVRTETLAGALAYGASQLSLASVAGVSVDTLLHIRSDAVWADDGEQIVKQGQLVRVVSVSGNTVTFSPLLDDDYAAGATVDILEKQIIKVDGLELRSTAPSGNVLSGLWIAGTLGTRIKAEVRGFGRDGISLETAFDTVIDGSVSDADESSTGYGITLYSSCQGTMVSANTDNSRTGVTLGGEVGPNRATTILGNYSGCFTAAVNTKAAAKGVAVGACTCSGRDGGLGDGIRLRGTDLTVSGAIVRGFTRYPVLLSLYGKTTREKLRGAVSGVVCPDSRDIIVLQAGGAGVVDALSAIGNQISFRPGLASASKGAIQVRGTSAKVENAVVMGNIISNCPFNGVDVRGAAGMPIDKLINDKNIINLTADAVTAGRTATVTSNVTATAGANL